jgi:hypothetical protein
MAEIVRRRDKCSMISCGSIADWRPDLRPHENDCDGNGADKQLE